MKLLRDYQRRTVEKVFETDKNLLICLPTGSGKTFIASAIMEKIEGTVIFVVPRLELIEQSTKEFGDVDIVWSDKTTISGKKIIVASKDSLRTQYKILPKNPTMIIDEAHISLEQTHKLVKLIQPKRVLGLTATPERMDGKALLKGDSPLHKFGCFDELLQEETVSSLIDKGYLTKLRYFTRPIQGITEIKPSSSGEELSDEQMTSIFDENKVWGDLVYSYEQYGKGRPAIGFTNTIAMAVKVSSIFITAGYKFEVIHGGMSVKERQSLILKLKNKQIDGLVNASLLTYGFDCPPVSYAFSCRHIKSRPLWFQIVGRILRLHDGKEDTIFIDHGDSISEFSEPNCSLPILDPAIVWKVNGESKEAKNSKKKELKRTQETMSLLQELDPLPVKMVEITVDNAWDRLIKILQKLKDENHKLINLVQNLNLENQKLSKEKVKVAEEATTLRSKLNTTEGKFIDPNKTFEFCRKNYPYLRGITHDKEKLKRGYWSMPPENRVQVEHDKTIEDLRVKFQHLPFVIDIHTFDKSMNWWKLHWKPMLEKPAFTPKKDELKF
ncbi:MAG: DEAD/DEAH box helicase [Bacteroidales bacterium]